MASYAATFSITYDTSASTAAVAAVFSQLVTALLAAGLTQTSDTGQVTASAIVNSTNINHNGPYGYQIWQFTDTLAGAHPVKFKIEYGDAGNVPAFWLTVGSTTDGAGNMTGNVSPRMTFIGAGGDGTPDHSLAQNSYISGDGANASGNARIAFALCEGPTRYPGCFFSIERTVDASGNDTTAGIIVNCILGNQAGSSTNAAPVPVLSMVIPYGSTVAGYQNCWISALNNKDSSLFFGTTVGTCLVAPFCFIPYKPGKNVMLYYTSDFPLYSTNTISVYGSNHTYLALNQQGNTSPTGGMTPWTTGIQNGVAAYPSCHVLMRYE